MYSVAVIFGMCGFTAGALVTLGVVFDDIRAMGVGATIAGMVVVAALVV